jgi:hypothetical protein
MFVFVTDKTNKPLMPTTPSRARRLIRSRQATPFWKKGLFCIRLNVDPSDTNIDLIAVGIDPGSKKEGITVKSQRHTYLNLQLDAVTWVKDVVKTRREMRRSRRFRKTPCRANRRNRKRGGLPPSTKARWQWKLRVIRWLAKIIPITEFVVEDIKAKTRGQRRWDVMFSPLQVGKQWFYDQLERIGFVHLLEGWQTKNLRDTHGLYKTKNKMAEVFAAHCVDSWVLANWLVGGHVKPDNQDLLCLTPLQFHRRQLHRLQPEAGGVRSVYGSTRSHGLTRGSLVQHVKYGLTYVGGYMKDRLSLHDIATGKRLTQKAKPMDCRFRTYNTWRRFLRPLKGAVSTPQAI